MTTLLPDYPPLKDCVYWVYVKGSEFPIGPFKKGLADVEDVPDGKKGEKTESRVILRFQYDDGRNKGSMGFNPDEVTKVVVICHGKTPVELDLVPDHIDLDKALDKLIDILKKGTTTVKPKPNTGASSGCRDGEVREEFDHSEEGNWKLKGIKEDDPYDHYKSALKKLKKALKKKIVDKVWKIVNNYFKVGSVAHIKCYVYAYYERVVIDVYEVEKCVDGVWVKQKPREDRKTEKAKVRLHVGGNPCQKPDVHDPPKEISSLDGIADWGWVESE